MMQKALQVSNPDTALHKSLLHLVGDQASVVPRGGIAPHPALVDWAPFTNTARDISF